MKLLHIDSSILGSNSVSRILTADLVETERRLNPGLEVVYRDLAASPLQHFSGAHAAVAHGAPASPGLDLDAGAAALAEVLAADIIVIGAPMYNFTIPTQLKAWIDRLAVPGKTFRYGEKGPEGLLKGKKILVGSTRGGAYAGTPVAFLDHQEAYIKAFFGFLGIADVQFFRAENLARTDLRDKSIESARAEIKSIAA